MLNKITLVIDTNLLVSAALSKKLRNELEAIVLNKNTTIVASKPLFEELTNVLNRSKFSKYFSQDQIDKFLYFWKIRAKLVNVKLTIKVCRDPKDDYILALAIASKANYILTGDKDLLVLNPFKDISIISLSEFNSL